MEQAASRYRCAYSGNPPNCCGVLLTCQESDPEKKVSMLVLRRPVSDSPAVTSTRPSPRLIRLGYQRPCCIGRRPTHCSVAGSNTTVSVLPAKPAPGWAKTRVPPADSSPPSGRNVSPPQKKSSTFPAPS